MTPRQLHSKAEILDVSGPDMMLECDLPDDYDGPAFALRRAVAVVRRTTRTRETSLLLGGDTSAVPRLMTALVDGGILADLSPRFVTVPRDAFEPVARLVPLTRGDDWDWMWTREPPPPVAGEHGLVRLGEECQAALKSFLAEHNPRTHGAPFARDGQTWLGRLDPTVAAHAGIVACGSVEPSGGGRPHLAGITVAPAARGRGLGTAVSAALTRIALAEQGVSTLGLYAVNDTARRLYRRLGYRCDHRLSTRLLDEQHGTPRDSTRS